MPAVERAARGLPSCGIASHPIPDGKGKGHARHRETTATASLEPGHSQAEPGCSLATGGAVQPEPPPFDFARRLCWNFSQRAAGMLCASPSLVAWSRPVLPLHLCILPPELCLPLRAPLRGPTLPSRRPTPANGLTDTIEGLSRSAVRHRAGLEGGIPNTGPDGAAAATFVHLERRPGQAVPMAVPQRSPGENVDSRIANRPAGNTDGWAMAGPGGLAGLSLASPAACWHFPRPSLSPPSPRRPSSLKTSRSSHCVSSPLSDRSAPFVLQAMSDAMLLELKQCFMEAYDDNQDGKIDIREVSPSRRKPRFAPSLGDRRKIVIS